MSSFIVHDVVVLPGFSATTGKQMGPLMNLIKRKLQGEDFDGLLAQNWGRFARDQQDGHRLYAECLNAGLLLVTRKDGLLAGRQSWIKRGLAGYEEEGYTRNEYTMALTAFTKYMVSVKRIESDPLSSLKPTDRSRLESHHPRRAHSTVDLAARLDAAARRPEHELLLVRRGPRRGTTTAAVRPAALERGRKRGCERRLAYLIAVWVGLRRKELRLLEWGDTHLDDGGVPRILLRWDTTKAKRGDFVVLHPQVAEELLAFRPARFSPADRVLRTVPSMKALKADLAFAGIDYGDRKIGYADLHALRKSMNTMMAVAGVSQRARQTQMRHTDTRLTEVTYMDGSHLLKPIAAELARVPAIPEPARSDEATATSGTTDDSVTPLEGAVLERIAPACSILSGSTGGQAWRPIRWT